MPRSFQDAFPTVRVIIDCTEIKVQTPSSLTLHSEFYSNYKSATTLKGLIGISPTGAVSFVSALYTGSISDWEITRRSGLVELLEPNDGVMADKGFTIEDILTPRNCTLNIPPFLREKPQFSADDVKKTQQIAKGLGTGDSGTRGLGHSRTQGRGDAGTRGRGDSEMLDARTSELGDVWGFEDVINK